MTVVTLLIATGVLDVISTLSAIERAGGWSGEMNPVFRLLRGSTSNHTVLIILIRLFFTTLVIIYFVSTVKKTSDLYPDSRRRRNLYGFLNYFFHGRDISFLQSLYLLPPAKRAFVGLSVPMAFGLISTSAAVFITNTFGLLDSTADVVIFIISTVMIGLLAAAVFLQREHHQSL